MKKLIAVFAVLINTLAFGQNANCIRVDYVESIGLDKSLDLDSALAEQLKGLLPDKIEMYNQLYLIGGYCVFRNFLCKRQHHIGQFLDRVIIFRIADVIDFSIRNITLVGDNAH